jgi:hypothetical protein
MQPNPYGAPPNPYAPPSPYGAPAAVPYGAYGPAPFQAWPDGPDLAVQKEAPLPGVCVKCGSHDAPNRRNQQFVWTPPWVFIFFLLSPIIGAIIAVIVQKKGRLLLPLCNDCSARWKQGMLFLGLSIVWLILGLIVGIAIAANDLPEVGVPLIISGFGALIAVAIVNRGRFLRVRKVDERMITLREVNQVACQAILNAAQGR